MPEQQSYFNAWTASLARFSTTLGNRPIQNMPAMQTQMETLAGSRKHNRRQIRRVLAPVNRTDDAEIVVKRNHHARQRREREAIITRILVAPCSITAFSSKNFPKKPASGGMPASDTIASVIVAASNGER